MPIPDPRERPLITIEETAAIFRWPRSTTYDAANRGELPTLRIGRRLYVKTAQLASLVGLDTDHSAEEGDDRAPAP